MLIKRILVIVLFFMVSVHHAQSNNDIIKEAQKLLVENYIFLDKAKETNTHLDALMKKNFFDKMTPPEFAKSFTQELQKITKDKHLRFSAPRTQKGKNAEKSFINNLSRYGKPMLRGFQLFKSNIGYIDLSYFGGNKNHLELIDLAMKGVESADALIIDMRRNGGGSPSTVNYLSSYFFNEKLLLNSIYSRSKNHTEELWVVDVEGRKRPKVPVFILTSKRTFSGAEDFSYTMQSRGRATIIGEVTGGGAHPTRGFSLSNGYSIGIPFARTINPVTKTNWEGTGVQPDIVINADDALEKAKELSKSKSIAYRDSYFKPLEEKLDNIKDGKVTIEKKKYVFEQLERLVKANMIDEGEVNNLGYGYIQKDQAEVGVVIFEFNTIAFPNSANTWDSLAEAYLKLDNKEKAKEYYEKAFEMDPEGWVGENAKEMLQKIKSL